MKSFTMTYARALRLDNYLNRSIVAAELPNDQLPDMKLTAKETLVKPSIIEAVDTMIGQAGNLYIASKPAYFDSKLVNSMQTCRTEKDLSSLNTCLNKDCLLYTSPSPRD